MQSDINYINYNSNILPYQRADNSWYNFNRNQNETQNWFPNFDFDDNFIASWTDLVLKRRFERSNTKKSCNYSISKFREKIYNYTLSLNKLERMYSSLVVLKKSLPQVEWDNKCSKVNEEQEKLKQIIEDLNNNSDEIKSVISLLSKRAAKRRNLKRKKMERSKYKRELNAEIAREHRRIDEWLKMKKDDVQQVKREETVKMEADRVLGKVTKNKTESKKMLTLLKTLNKLRDVRIQHSPVCEDENFKEKTKSFNLIIEKLEHLWSDRLKDYNLEEQGLRVMLNDAEEERTKIEEKEVKKILREWEKTLFGSIRDNYRVDDLQKLCAIRTEWDRFTTTDNSVIASNIPVGWIIPAAPSNDDWKRHLAQHS